MVLLVCNVTSSTEAYISSKANQVAHEASAWQKMKETGTENVTKADLLPVLGIAYLIPGIAIALLSALLPSDDVETFFLPAVISANLLLAVHLFACLRAMPRGFLASLTFLVPLFYYLTHFAYQTGRILGVVEQDAYIEFGQYYEATLLALSGFLLLLSGIGFASMRTRKLTAISEAVSEPSPAEDRLNIMAIILGTAFFGIYMEELFRIGIGEIAASAYNDPWLWGRFSRFFDAAQTLFMYSMLLCAATVRAGSIKRSIILPIVCCGAWFSFNLFLGFRGHIMIFALSLLAIVSIRIHVINKWGILLVILLFIVSLPIIGAVRGEGIAVRDYGKATEEGLDTEKILETFIRTPGQLITTVARSMELYPSVFPLLLGTSYLKSLEFAIPNFSGEKGREGFMSFAQFMSFYYFGGIAMEGGGQKGVGSTPLAEAYANFWFFGVFILFGIGYSVSTVERLCYEKPDALRTYLYSITYYIALWTMRNDSLSWLRTFLWSWLLWLLVKFLSTGWYRIWGRGTDATLPKQIMQNDNPRRLQ